MMQQDRSARERKRLRLLGARSHNLPRAVDRRLPARFASKGRRGVRAALALVMALSLSLPAPALAWAADDALAAGVMAGAQDVSPEVWDGTSTDVSWYVDNPDADVYTLSTPAQLAGFAALVNGTSEASDTPLTFRGKTVRLGADIWLNAEAASDYDATGTQNVWTPIGAPELLDVSEGVEGLMPHYSDGIYFDGTFDGCGHVVKNLYIYRNLTGTYGGVQGFFGNAGGNAVICNFGIDSGYVYGRGAWWLVTAYPALQPSRLP